MRPEGWEEVHRVLAVYPGDEAGVLALGPALHSLRTALEGAAVTLMAPPACTAAAALLPEVERVLAWTPPPGAIDRHGGIAPDAVREMDELLRGGGYDAAVVFTVPPGSSSVAASLCRLAGPLRPGTSQASGGGVVHPGAAPAEDVRTEAPTLLLLERAGPDAAGPGTSLRIPAQAAAAAAGRLRAAGVGPGEPFVLVEAGAADHPSALAGRLAAETRLGVVRVAADDPAVERAALARRARLVVARDGLLAVAAGMLGTPLLLLRESGAAESPVPRSRVVSVLDTAALGERPAETEAVSRAVRELLAGSGTQGAPLG